MIKVDTIVMAAMALALLSSCAFADQDTTNAGDVVVEVVRYEDFGAKGDGETDDIAAIAGAHEYANRHGLRVKADDDATYYIGGADTTVVIQTDTDFGAARFIIDDRNVENRRAHIFTVHSTQATVTPEGVASLTRNQRRIEADLPGTCVVLVKDSHTTRHIRRGNNRNRGTTQSDVFVVEKDGTVDMNTPILWDFDRFTSIVAYPVDTTPLTIRGGRFTTIANAAESKYTYYARGIEVRRSNVTIDGLEHRVTGEGDHGAPYYGFIRINECADVTVRNCILSGHKTYQTIGSTGKTVSMGSYDITVDSAVNVSFVNCRQANDITDRTRWGIMASNGSKNMLYDHCELSRFDAHRGVADATIRHSTLGHAGINAIGNGTLLVEHSTNFGRAFINLRGDYGSTWQGEFIIRNCTFVPSCGAPVSASLIGGYNDGHHDFGYICYMPRRIVIDNLHIDDANHPEDYEGPTIFTDFNPGWTNAASEQKYPYVRTRQVILNDVTTASGEPLRLSEIGRAHV